jgi:hypothetical protein
MGHLIKRFAGDTGGATAIEYGLIASLIAVAIIAYSARWASTCRRPSPRSRLKSAKNPSGGNQDSGVMPVKRPAFFKYRGLRG